MVPQLSVQKDHVGEACPGGCGYMITDNGHPTHCCGQCSKNNGHGARCQKVPFEKKRRVGSSSLSFAATAMEIPPPVSAVPGDKEELGFCKQASGNTPPQSPRPNDGSRPHSYRKSRGRIQENRENIHSTTTTGSQSLNGVGTFRPSPISPGSAVPSFNVNSLDSSLKLAMARVPTGDSSQGLKSRNAYGQILDSDGQVISEDEPENPPEITSSGGAGERAIVKEEKTPAIAKDDRAPSITLTRAASERGRAMKAKKTVKISADPKEETGVADEPEQYEF